MSTANGSSNIGVAWFRPSVLRRVLLAAVTALALFAVSIAPAAAKPGGGGGGSTAQSSSVSQSCSDVLGDDTTTSLDDIREQVGADYVQDKYDLFGNGVGVAVIDTGVNAVEGLTGTKVIDGPDLSFDALEDNLRYRDLQGHGTNMAAIIAARNSDSGDGVAPDAHLINVKVGAGDGTVDVSQVIAAIDWVVQNRDTNGQNIRVINLAYDTDSTQDYVLDPLSHAVENAWNAGIVVVVAGGNDGRGIARLGNPAINPFVIAVGASEMKNGWKVPVWSSTGDDVRNPDLLAPGSLVLSAGVAGSYLASTYPGASCTDRKGNMYLRGSGTSQAAAVVSGAAALLLEQRPELTPDQVKYLLTSTAIDIGHQPKLQGHGVIDVQAAIEAPTPGYEAVQTHQPSTGLGTLEDARGTEHVGTDGDFLEGEMTAWGDPWDSETWAAASNTGSTWTGSTWTGSTWTGSTWSGSTWSGSTWSGSTWSGSTWSGSTWSGSTWSGSTWSGSTWSGSTWSGSTWSGSTWSGATWSGATWS